MNIEDQQASERPADLASRKISNGQISASGHQIHFLFGSRIRISRLADRTAPLPRRRPTVILQKCKWVMNISATGRPVHFVFGSGCGYSGLGNNARGID